MTQNKRICYESHEYEIFWTTQRARHICSNYNQDKVPHFSHPATVMNKPDILPVLPGSPATSGQVAQVPSAFVQSPVSAQVANSRAAAPPTRPASQAAAPEYVDPYLFETGYYASPAEEHELSRTAASRIRLRAEVENARPKRRS